MGRQMPQERRFFLATPPPTSLDVNSLLNLFRIALWSNYIFQLFSFLLLFDFVLKTEEEAKNKLQFLTENYQLETIHWKSFNRIIFFYQEAIL